MHLGLMRAPVWAYLGAVLISTSACAQAGSLPTAADDQPPASPASAAAPSERNDDLSSPRSSPVATPPRAAPAPEASARLPLAPLAAEVAPKPVVIAYDRNLSDHLDPFPDDFFLVADATQPTGRRVAIPTPLASLGLGVLLDALIAPTRRLDGHSPLAPIIVALPAELDAASLPVRAEDSVDPHASLALIDVDPASPERGQRVPFYALQRKAMETDGSVATTLLVFPAHPLRGRGRYAFVIARSARTLDGLALGPSEFMERLLDGQPTSLAERKLAPSVREHLNALAALSSPIQRGDIALLLGITVRSTDHIADDLIAIREQLTAAAAPSFRIIETAPGDPAQPDVAAIVSGEWRPRSFRDGSLLARDALGRPRSTGTAPIAFTLALPRAALSGPVPMIMYQHGQPGSAEAEIPKIAGQGLAADGFAVIGFTDLPDREIISDGNLSGYYLQILTTLLTSQRLPDYMSVLSLAEQLAFLRLIPQLGALDILPLDKPDGRPDLDPARPLGYLGISEGASHGLGLLAFAPELHAAALATGAGNFGALLIQQAAGTLYDGLSQLMPDLTHAQLYVAIALIQMAYDSQDPQNLAHFAYSAPLALEADKRASVLLTEGLGDSLVPFYAMRSAAWQLGLPQLTKAAERVSFLQEAAAPLVCDPAAGAHGAFYQFVATGYPGSAPTPGCVGKDQGEGHACAQSAAEAIEQRREFFKSSLTASTRIIDPLP